MIRFSRAREAGLTGTCWNIPSRSRTRTSGPTRSPPTSSRASRMPAGSTLTLRGPFPRARYFKLALYKAEGGTFVSTGEDWQERTSRADPGSTNPFVVGNDRLGEPRDYTVSIVARGRADDPGTAQPNTLYAGTDGGDLQLVTARLSVRPGQRRRRLGALGFRVQRRGACRPRGHARRREAGDRRGGGGRFRPTLRRRTAQPFTAAQWTALVNSKDNDPALDPATAPARKDPKWEKYWNIKYSILGSFKTPEEQAKIPFAGPIDGGGDPDTQYLLVQLSRKFGPVFVTRGKMPSFPNTYSGAAGRGLETMPDCADPVFLGGELRGRAVGPDRRRAGRHAGSARCRRQLHDRLQPRGGPSGERHGRERRRLDRVEPARRGPGYAATTATISGC